MTKEKLINQAIVILQKSGHTISDRCNIRPRSFDIAAGNDDVLLLIKVLSNVDGLKEDTAQEMLQLSEYLDGTPLVIGEKSRDHSLESGVVYYRYGIPAINIDTLYDYFVEEVPPIVYAAPGGLYVNVDGHVLHEMRLYSNLSIGALASELGVSRRSISKYEEDGMDMSVDMVMRLEEMFNQAIAIAIDFLNVDNKALKKRTNPVETEPGISIRSILSSLDMDVMPVSQAPFNAVSFEHTNSSKNKNMPIILTGFSDYTSAMVKRAKLMSSISEVTKAQSMFIVNGVCKTECVDNTVLLKKSEIEEMEDFNDLISFIYEKLDRVKCA
ncbi:MAG: transcriptional regulator [ANME-2 cluster archaeon]|nr:transcriptional regulator [ANME-2 cluster archaeon]MDF1530811.1 transcriptional regulator [ANME-2 cluster archaeon]